MMTNGYNNNVLSNNASDIESALFGIGSTNLVKQKAPVKPELNCMGNVKFFNRLETVMPKPLVVEKFQRPIGPLVYKRLSQWAHVFWGPWAHVVNELWGA